MNIRSFLIIFAMSSLLYSEENFGIVVHGGAGVGKSKTINAISKHSERIL